MEGSVFVYINPPTSVHDALAALTQECWTWKPTELQVDSSHPPSLADGQTTEAQVCSFIRHPDAQFWSGVNVTILAVLLLWAFFFFTRLHRLPRWLFYVFYNGFTALALIIHRRWSERRRRETV